MEHELNLSSTEAYDLIEALNVAIRDQEDLLPDYKARVMIDGYGRLRDRIKNLVNLDKLLAAPL